MKDTLLLVDDDPLILNALERTLRQENYKIFRATSGEEAVQILKQHTVSAMLCDQNMPNKSGIEVLQEARRLCPQATRLLITGSQDLDTLIQAVNIGQISQFILKPWDSETLKQIVQAAVAQYRLRRENEELHAQVISQHEALQQAHEALRGDLAIGARIHEVLLIGDPPQDMKECKLQVLTRPSKEIDGDFYEFYRPAEHILDVVLGDVMGKGIPAALVGTAVKSQMQRLATPLSREEQAIYGGPWTPKLLRPSAILEGVQKELASKLIDLEYFVTLFYGRFDFRELRFSYIDCGSTKPIHFRPKDQSLHFLSGNNLPLGFVHSETFEEKSVPFEKEDLFLFYSDGVTETRHPDGSLYGTERLVSTLKNYPRCEPRALNYMIEQSALKFGQRDHLEDDLTLLAIQVQKDWEPEPIYTQRAQFANELSQLEAVREFVVNTCSQVPDYVEDESGPLQLAMNEIFCNIVEHSGIEEGRGEVHIEAQLKTEGICFEVLDKGQAFRPSNIEEPSLSGDRSGGFGLYLIRNIMDKVCYEPKTSASAWNRLCLYKQFKLKGACMQVSHSCDGNVLVITLEGQHLDAKHSPNFKESVRDIINTQKANSVVFNLEQLQFIDSSGLGSFLSVLRHLHSQGGDLKLASASKDIQTMLEMVRMHKLFEIYNSSKEAVQSFDPI